MVSLREIMLRIFFPPSHTEIGALERASAPDNPDTFAVFAYMGAVRRIIHDCKYRNRCERMDNLIAKAAPHIVHYLSSCPQYPVVLVPIPLHTAKLRRRGFNHTAYIAHALAPTIKGSYVKAMLKKIRPTKPQARTKNKGVRLSNVTGSMAASAPIDPSILYVLIDDVTTTGATFAEAKRALHAAGARFVQAIALAH
jgi:predicted amidophosphoribosyltransferase